MAKHLHAGHRKRLRDRVDNFGLDSLEDHEFLELLLFYGIPRKNTNLLAHDLLDHFGKLENVFSASVEELMECGLPRRAAFWIAYLPDFAQMFSSGSSKAQGGYADAAAEERIKKDCRGLPPGKLYVASLSDSGEVCHSELFDCDPKSFSGNVANVCKAALRCEAYSIIIAQTYEEDHFTPDPIDCEETIKYHDGLNVFGIRLADRFHVSGNNVISYNGIGALCLTEKDLKENDYYRLVSMEET